MGKITCRFVRPDRLLFEGEVDSLILVTERGELGVWPMHAPMICALGDGVVRLHLGQEAGGAELHVIVMGGYAEVKDDEVIVLADHARRSDDIDEAVVKKTRAKAVAARDVYVPGDNRRLYYDNKIRWCDLLLSHV